jgi:outer membrane protein TolC
MARQIFRSWIVALATLILVAGCSPTQPFYFFEDGDLSHYRGVATEIEYPDVHELELPEVSGAFAPLTIEADVEKVPQWDLTLEEAVQITLANTKNVRTLSGRVGNVEGAPDQLIRQPTQSVSIYDPALEETNPGFSNLVRNGVGTGRGVEAALSDFDTQLAARMFFNKNDRPLNVANQFAGLFQPVLIQNNDTFLAQLQKTNATGGTAVIRNNTAYDQVNNPTRAVPSDWTTNFEMGYTQPLLQGYGVDFNRISGPNSTVGNPRGVVLSRINTDLTLADLEVGIRDLTRETETAYWELYFAYRNLEAVRAGRESSRATWERIKTLYEKGLKGGEAEKEAQSREQFWLFQGQVQEALNNLLRSETRLRQLMGIAVSDGRLIKPADAPTEAKVAFDWVEVRGEGLARSPELRQQKWRIKSDELQLVAAKNFLLPRLDAVGLYRWLGMGDDLISSDRVTQTGPISNSAFQSLTSGQFQEWQLGLNLTVPIGFRQQLANVRHRQMGLARDRARLEDMELELLQQLAEALRNVTRHYDLTTTNFNRLVAAEQQVRAVQSAYDVGTVTLDLLLDAQRRRAEAMSAYFRSIVNYNLAINEVHWRKGSLLEYNNVYLSEGPWPSKAYYDAKGLARQRDAALFLNYGYTLPKVFSRGPINQRADSEGVDPMWIPQPEVIESGVPTPAAAPAEQIPTPARPASARRFNPPAAAQPVPAGPKFDWGELGLKPKSGARTYDDRVTAASYGSNSSGSGNERITRNSAAGSHRSAPAGPRAQR